MMTLILHHIFHKRKVIAVGLLCIVYMAIIWIIGMTNETALDRLLYPQSTAQYYHVVSSQIMKFVLTALLATMAFDFNASYEEPLYAYFTKYKVVKIKMITYILLVILLSIFINIMRISVELSTQAYINKALLISSFSIVIDALILFGWMLLLTPKKYSQSAFIIVIIYLLISMIQEDNPSNTVYYMIPFYQHIYSHYSFSHVYVTIYGIILLCLVYLKEIN